MDEVANQNVEGWQRLEEIYHAALSLTTAEREAFVARATAGDAALFGEVMSLLAADDKAHGFLQEPAFSLGLEILAEENLQNGGDSTEVTQPAPVDPMIGLFVGDRYRVVGSLGRGGMGDVYLARDKPEMLHRPVVIKVLREERLGDKWVVAKFKQEAEALTKIDDHGVVGILDAGTLPGGKPFLVMQYVEGQTLNEYLRDKRAKQEEVELQDAAEIMRQVGRTLYVAHRAGIVHRDLKPANIMLRWNASGDLQVKVIDFGIAKVTNSALASSTETVFIAGTWQYMSPEQLRREKATPLSDIYALGVIAYEILTGRRPFNAKNPVRLAELQKAGIRVMPRDLRPEGVSEVAQQTLLKALSYQPGERQQSAREFGDEYAQALAASEADSAKSPPPVSPEASTREAAHNAAAEAVAAAPLRAGEANRWTARTAAWLRTHWRWAAAAVAAVILLTSLLGFAVWSKRQPPSGAERVLTYWLEVRMCLDRVKQCQDEKTAAFGKPITSIGDEIFNDGSKIKFHFLPEQSGFLYLFNKGPVNNGATGWHVLFPHRAQNNGSAQLPGGREFSTLEHGPLDKNDGIEEVWVVWSEKPIRDLETICEAAFDNGNGGKILDPAQQNTLSSFLGGYAAGMPEPVSLGDSTPRADFKGRGEILVGLMRLRHQDY